MVDQESQPENIGNRARRIVSERRAWLMETAEQIVAGPTEPPRFVALWRVIMVVLFALNVIANFVTWLELRHVARILEVQ